MLNQEAYSNINSRAALSLLAYCHYSSQDFDEASKCYEQLVHLYPDAKNYRLNLAKCCYQMGDYGKAMKVAYDYTVKYTASSEQQESGSTTVRKHSLVDEDLDLIELIKLQAAIKYLSEDESIQIRLLIEQLPNGNVDKEANLGCLLYKEGKYEEAIEKFQNCVQMESLNWGQKSGGGGGGGTRMDSGQRKGDKGKQSPDLLYNLAVCHYKLKQYEQAIKFIGDIIEQGIQDHPELSIGMTTEGIDVRSVGNTEVLHESVLIEAFNLKSAIEYQFKNIEAAKEALTDMPPRSEEELDSITLHNMALVYMDTNPTESFEKLQFLVGQESFPEETFANLLLLYCKHEYFELAADLMAENAGYTYRYLSSYLYEFFDALITQQTSPEDAYTKFDDIASRYMDNLRKLNKQIGEITIRLDNETGGTDEQTLSKQRDSLKKLNSSYDETLQAYVPVLMLQAKIYWDLENYVQVEKVFRKSAEFCNELDLWKLNVAHVLFMQVSPGPVKVLANIVNWTHTKLEWADSE